MEARVFVALLALLVAALFWQPAAFVSALAYGFFLPGFLALKALRFKAPLHAFLPAVVLSSVLISTQAVYWVSLVIGYSLFSIISSFALLSLIAFFVPFEDLRRLTGTGVRSVLREKTRGFATECWGDCKPFFGAVVIFVVFFSVLSASLWVTASDGSVIVGGWNYSDFFLHKGIIETVNAGNFPPQEPTFAGVSIAYHWFSDFHTAFLSKASGVPAELFARFETALYGAMLFLGVYALAAAFFEKKEWRKRAAFLAAVLFVFGGSFAYLQLFDASASAGVPVDSSFLDFVKNKGPFDNDWKFFQVPSLIPGYLLVQRPQAIGIPALVLVLFLAFFARGDKRLLAFAGLLCGFAAPFQFYAFAAAALGVTLWFAFRFAKEKFGRRGVVEEYAFFFVPCAVFAAPSVFSALLRSSGAGLMRLAPFWLAPPATSDPLGFASFYAANFGLVFLLALCALALAAFRPNRRFEGALFLAVFASALFVIPNAVSLSGTQWDMAKFFTYLMIPCAVLAAFLLARLPRIVIAAAILLSVVSPVISLYWYSASDWRGLSGEDVAVGEWIKANTPERSVFLSAPVHNSPIDSVGGRLRVTGYAGWMNNYGLPYQARESDLRQAYCGTAEEAASVARKYDARFVWLGGSERGTYENCAFEFSSSSLFSKVFDSGGVQIYELR